MASVHQIVRPGCYPFLTEVGYAKRSVPGLAAIVRVVEPGWTHMNVFHPHGHGETWLAKIDASRTIRGLLPSRLRGHARDLRAVRGLQSFRMFDAPGFTAIQAA